MSILSVPPHNTSSLYKVRSSGISYLPALTYDFIFLSGAATPCYKQVIPLGSGHLLYKSKRAGW